MNVIRTKHFIGRSSHSWVIMTHSPVIHQHFHSLNYFIHVSLHNPNRKMRINI